MQPKSSSKEAPLWAPSGKGGRDALTCGPVPRSPLTPAAPTPPPSVTQIPPGFHVVIALALASVCFYCFGVFDVKHPNGLLLQEGPGHSHCKPHLFP